MTVRIRDLEIDDDNAEHLARHGVSERTAFQVLDGEHVLIRNKKGRRGEYVMIGPDFGGRMWTIVLARTDAPDVWRPVTGWQSTQGEVTVSAEEALMGKRKQHEVVKEEDWEVMEDVEVVRPVGAVLSVRFNRESVEKVFDAAEPLGLTSIEFVRRAALLVASDPQLLSRLAAAEKPQRRAAGE